MAEEEYNEVGLGAAITVSFRDGDGNGDPLFPSHCADRCARAANMWCIQSYQKV